MTTKYVVTVTTQSHTWLEPGVRTHPVEVVDADKRLVKYQSGDIVQLRSPDELYDSPAEALLAGAGRMQAQADVLAAAAQKAMHEAAQLAAAGRVTVCST